jgi:tetratricopeptide (TPR) repeat protein
MLLPSMGRPARSGRVAALAITGMLAVSLAGCTKIAARDLIREGNTLYNDGKFVEALDKYDSAEELEPDGWTLFWNRACAAEAQVLRMKEPNEKEERRTFADRALRDFQTWYDRLPTKTEDDEKQLLNHRLAILKADERCSELITHWEEQHRLDPKKEPLYARIAQQYDECGQPDKHLYWLKKRAEDFPESVQAWHTLAVHSFTPLYPDPETGLAFNESLPPSERIRIANEVIKLLDKVNEINRDFRDAYVWKAMAYTQKQHARLLVEEATSPKDRLENLDAREDSMMAWKQQKAVCDLDALSECPEKITAETPPCCPKAPLTTAEQAADAESRKLIEAELAAPPPDEDPKGKRRGKNQSKNQRGNP